jgi:6-phosphogluconolactonase
METIVDAPSRLATVFTERALELAHVAFADGRPFTIALPGGSVARAFLPALAGAPLDWSRVHCFWGDERAVPADDPESNYALSNDLLLSRVPIPAGNVHRMIADVPDLAAAAASYERELATVLGDRLPIDLILIGVGPDGHVCSLFPGHASLGEQHRRVLAIEDSPKPPPRRLTLTLPALARTEIHIGAFGAEKAAVVREALHDPQSQLPVSLCARAATRAIFLLDDAVGVRR